MHEIRTASRRASSEMEMAAAVDVWCRETVPRVMELVSPHLSQRDACSLLAVSPWCYRALVANLKLWEVRSVYSPTTNFFCSGSCPRHWGCSSDQHREGPLPRDGLYYQRKHNK